MAGRVYDFESRLITNKANMMRNDTAAAAVTEHDDKHAAVMVSEADFLVLTSPRQRLAVATPLEITL